MTENWDNRMSVPPWLRTHDAKTLQNFVVRRAAKGATVYTDEHGAYKGLPNPELRTTKVTPSAKK